MNMIIIHGRITKAPELKTVGSGNEVCKFTVAVNRPVGKDKEKVADFFDVDAWGQTGAFVERYFNAGDGVIVQGEMQSRKYEKDGEKRTAWSVHANRVEFAEKKGDSASSDATGSFTDVSDEDAPF